MGRSTARRMLTGPTLPDVQDAKTRLSELLVRVERGEQITIARSGRPVARLSGIESAPRELGFVPGLNVPDSFFEPLPEDELGLCDGR
jgi:prevent-host-death family protein